MSGLHLNLRHKGVPGRVAGDVFQERQQHGRLVGGVEMTGDYRHIQTVAGIRREAFPLAVDVVGAAVGVEHTCHRNHRRDGDAHFPCGKALYLSLLDVLHGVEALLDGVHRNARCRHRRGVEFPFGQQAAHLARSHEIARRGCLLDNHIEATTHFARGHIVGHYQGECQIYHQHYGQQAAYHARFAHYSVSGASVGLIKSVFFCGLTGKKAASLSDWPSDRRAAGAGYAGHEVGNIAGACRQKYLKITIFNRIYQVFARYDLFFCA